MDVIEGVNFRKNMTIIKKGVNMQCVFKRIPYLKQWQRLNYNNYSGLDLKEILAEKIMIESERVKQIRKEFGDQKISDVTVCQLYGGLRGVKSLICDTSELDPEEGIRFRGLSIPECVQRLPKATPDGEQPLPEGVFWLLLTGDVPTKEQTDAVSEDWAGRASLPPHVSDFLVSIPKIVHPMSQLTSACTIMNTQSEFVKACRNGVQKTDIWQYAYEDAMNLLANLPLIAARIYRHTFKDGQIGDIDTNMDWSYNFAKMLGYDEFKFVELLRLYLTIHSDHEGGNVSAHTTHLVASAYSDPYLAYSAGMNGLAGPLHGLASQEVVIWIEKLCEKLGKNPSEAAVAGFVNDCLESGQVIPGFGHAVLRRTDPRYTTQRDFAMKYLPDDDFVKIAAILYKVVPPILRSLGKVQNPWPNVDAHSGVLLQHFGMKEISYYTVLFAVSRALGVLSQLIWSRALCLPIERPKSISLDVLTKHFRIAQEAKM